MGSRLSSGRPAIRSHLFNRIRFATKAVAKAVNSFGGASKRQEPGPHQQARPTHAHAKLRYQVRAAFVEVRRFNGQQIPRSRLESDSKVPTKLTRIGCDTYTWAMSAFGRGCVKTPHYWVVGGDGPI